MISEDSVIHGFMDCSLKFSLSFLSADVYGVFINRSNMKIEYIFLGCKNGSVFEFVL